MKIISIIFILIILQFSFPLHAALDVEQLKGGQDEKSLLENRKLLQEDRKLLQEDRKLQIENDWVERSLGIPISFAPFFTAIIALISVFFTICKYITETSRQKKAEFEQAKLEKGRDFEEKFTSIFKNLCSSSEDKKASAAGHLLTIFNQRNKEFCNDMLPVLIANMKDDLHRTPLIMDLLTRTLERGIRLKFPIYQVIKNQRRNKFNKMVHSFFQRNYVKLRKQVDKKQPIESKPMEILNLSRTNMIRPDFEGINLQGVKVDIAFSKLALANLTGTQIYRLRGIKACLYGARMSRANLQEARLNKADCRKALFHESILISATFKEANLKKAEFTKARLQSAHFEYADIRGAKFEGANLNDAYFKGAILDLDAKRSLINAKNWRKANFDPKVFLELHSLEAQRNIKN